MQDALVFEREALRRLPELLAELLDILPGEVWVEHQARGPDFGYDAVAEAAGRRWVIEVKASSRPGTVASAASQLSAYPDEDAIRILLVPHMTRAGEKVAAERRLNWMDLSGNASIRDDEGSLYISVHGRANRNVSRGRPSSPFAPKSARVTRTMLLDPSRWWRQKELCEATGLDDGSVSRIVRRLHQEQLLDKSGPTVRPLDPDLLLDAWDDEYRFDRHDIVFGHVSGAGIELARKVADRLQHKEVGHAFTGLPAAWLLRRFAQFRLVSVYVDDDPRAAADALDLQREKRGANVQLIGPNDTGVFAGGREVDDLRCVAPVQIYLDLKRLPERSAEAAEDLRRGRLWNAA